MKLKFGSWDKEAEGINSGKIKKIVREIDWHDPRFKEIEKINGLMALYEQGDLRGHKHHMIYIDGKCDMDGVIKKISYQDGNVIIEWD